MDPSVTAVVVSFASAPAAARAARSLHEQSVPPREVLIVDNGGGEDLDAEELPGEVTVVRPGVNLGYTGAVNLAAKRARGEWLFLLNPDASAAGDCLERLVESIDGPEVAIVGAQVLLPDGRVNAGDNPINIAGISWAGNYGRPPEQGPPRDVAAVSGTALLVRRDLYLELGGLCPFFFMYVDDTDLAWRVRLAGGRVRFCPAATVAHEYEFEKGKQKWFYLERNRLWAVLSNLQLRTLLLLLPVFLGAEVAVLVRAAREHWLRAKLDAWVSLVLKLPQLLRWRRSVQATRRVPDSSVLALFVGGMSTALPGDGLPPWVNASLERYRRLVLRLLGAP
jgi:GT2 family glycosyltransferase